MVSQDTKDKIQTICSKHGEDPAPWIDMLEVGDRLTDSYVVNKKGEPVSYSKEIHAEFLVAVAKCEESYGEVLFRLMGKELQWADRMGELNKRIAP